MYERYRRPILIAETGAEGDNGPGWLSYIGGEIRRALRLGLPIQGICLYPVMDYPGWHDFRHCPCGLIRLDAEYRARRIDPALALALEEEAVPFAPLLGYDAAMPLAAD